MSLQSLFTEIADAIREKDGTTDNIVANTFPERVRAIPSGGAAPTTPLDPKEVYKNTRPADWLPMPEPQDNEMYLLFHIPDGASSLLAFKVTCTGNYTVSLGTVSNGAFVQQSAESRVSGAKYETQLFANDYGDLTSDGFKQVMVKVSGTNIKTWEPSTHSKKPLPSSFCGWNIVEIVCRLPNAIKVTCGSSTQNKSLMRLRYFLFRGGNSVTDADNMFYSCYSLTAIPEINTSNVTNMSRMFSNCYSLTAIPEIDTSKVTSMNYMFSKCYSLTAIPEIDIPNVTNTADMFSNCYSLTAIPEINTSNVTNMSRMFSDCYSLTAIPEIDTSKVTYMAQIFEKCDSLNKITFNNSVTGWAGVSFSLANCSLMHNELVELFNSLPTITTSKTLTLTGNPGVSDLTDAEKAIATEKGWTLTL